MKPINNNTQKNTSFSALQKIVVAFGAAAFLAYAAPALAQQEQKSEKKKEQPAQVQKVTIPHLKVDVYNPNGKLYKSFNDLHVLEALSSPVTVMYGDSIDIRDASGKPVIINEKSLDVLIQKMEDGYMKEYVNNPNPSKNKGLRAFDSKIKTTESGLTPGLYAFYASIEETGKIDIKKIDPSKKYQINASILGFLYVQENCPPPTVQTKIITKEVPINIPSGIVAVPVAAQEVPKEEKCRPTSLTIGGFYTGDKRYGIDFLIDKRVADFLALGAGGFYMPSSKQEITTNVQRDLYDVEGVEYLGETNLVAHRDSEIIGLLAETILGKCGKVNLAAKGGVFWDRNHFSYDLVQTVKNSQTGEILDEYVCRGGSDKLTKLGYRLEADLLVPFPFSKGVSVVVGGGIIGNLPTNIEARYNDGNTIIPMKLGKAQVWNASIGVRFKL